MNCESSIAITRVCSHCKEGACSEVAYVACGSETLWKLPEHAPTLPVHVVAPLLVNHWEKDDIQIWEIGLCNSCKIACYYRFLLNHINTLRRWFIYGPLALAGSIILGIIINRYFGELNEPSIFNILLFIVFLILLVAGFLCFPYSILMYLIYSSRIRRFDHDKVIPTKNILDLIYTEAEIMLEEGIIGTYMKTGFILPVFKEQNDYAKTTQKKIETLQPSERVRVIIGVEETRVKLVKNLNQEWRQLLKND